MPAMRSHIVQCSNCHELHPNPVNACARARTVLVLRVLVNLLPHLLDVFPLFLCVFAVLPGTLEALGAQAHVDLVLCFGAIAKDLVHEAAGVALVEGCDHIGAVCKD